MWQGVWFTVFEIKVSLVNKVGRIIGSKTYFTGEREKRRRSTRCFKKSWYNLKLNTQSPRQYGRIFIDWFGRGCLLISGTISGFVSVIYDIYAEVYAAINIVGVFFFALTVVAVT
jgi:hypothetical protein